jgi:hypothetical protein
MDGPFLFVKSGVCTYNKNTSLKRDSMKITNIILYSLFLGIVTFFVSGYGQANRTFVFLSEVETKAKENIHDLIVATMIANTQNQYDLYVSNEPLIETYVSLSDVSMLFSIYSVLSYDTRDKYQFDYVILITDYNNQDVSQKLLEDRGVLHVVLKLESVIPSLQIHTISSTMVGLYDDTMYMMILNQSYLNEFNEFNEVQSISVQYENELGQTTILTIQDENELTKLQKELAQDKTFNITRCGEWYYNEALHEIFESLNWVQIRPLVYELFVVIPMTYWLFLHKKLKQLRRLRKDPS